MQSARYTVVFGYEVRNPTNLFLCLFGEETKTFEPFAQHRSSPAHILKGLEVCWGSFEERE